MSQDNNRAADDNALSPTAVAVSQIQTQSRHLGRQVEIAQRSLALLFEAAIEARRLPQREEAVLRIRLLEHATLSDAGKRLGLSHQRIGQIERRALRRLRMLPKWNRS